MDLKFWNNKKVLVTGAGGFVGRNLVPILKNASAAQILTPSRQECDLSSGSQVENYFKAHKPNIVLHLAGKVGGVAANKAQPGDFFYNNILMGVHVTHQAFANNIEKMVSLAAGCGYPKNLPVPFNEDGFWMGLPDENSYGYSMAKKNLIIQSWAYREQYGFDSTVLLPANLYGPNDNFDLETSHVVPALVRKFIEAEQSNSEEVEVWGSGTATREFLYVEDTAHAIIDITEKSKGSGPFNLGTGTETSIKELVSAITEATGFKGHIKWNASRPDGQPRRFYDMRKFKEATGYVPSTTLQEGISKTVDWYKKTF